VVVVPETFAIIVLPIGFTVVMELREFPNWSDTLIIDLRLLFAMPNRLG
jgi:hypothetical protein